MKSFETIFFNFFVHFKYYLLLDFTYHWFANFSNFSSPRKKLPNNVYRKKKVFALMKNNQQVQSYHEIQEQKK